MNLGVEFFLRFSKVVTKWSLVTSAEDPPSNVIGHGNQAGVFNVLAVLSGNRRIDMPHDGGRGHRIACAVSDRLKGVTDVFGEG